jgi:hypothetical protein
MKFIKIYLVIILFCPSIHSQNKNIDCQKINEDFQYFQIIIFSNNIEPLFINVVGDNINFDILSKESLSNFIRDLYEKYNFVPSFITDRNFYLNECNPTNIDKMNDLKFVSKFNGEVEKLSKKSKKLFDLKTGERIQIKGIGLKGTFLQFRIADHNFQKISFYPNELYECTKIKNYLIPLNIEKFYKIKNCGNVP